MTSLPNPSSARRMILARITSQYGDVYFLAMNSSACRSSLERLTENALFLGIRDAVPLMQVYQVTSPLGPSKYVTVFANRCTKEAAERYASIAEMRADLARLAASSQTADPSIPAAKHPADSIPPIGRDA